MSLEVNMDVVATVVHLRICSMSVSMTSDFWYEGLPLPRRPSQLPTVEGNPLHDEDGEEAGSHDELRQRETGLFDANTDKLDLSRHSGVFTSP